MPLATVSTRHRRTKTNYECKLFKSSAYYCRIKVYLFTIIITMLVVMILLIYHIESCSYLHGRTEPHNHVKHKPLRIRKTVKDLLRVSPIDRKNRRNCFSRPTIETTSPANNITNLLVGPLELSKNTMNGSSSEHNRLTNSSVTSDNNKFYTNHSDSYNGTHNNININDNSNNNNRSYLNENEKRQSSAKNTNINNNKS